MGEPGVLGVADAALASPPTPVDGFQEADVGRRVVGDEHLVAIPVGVGEGELGPGVRLLTTNDHAGAVGPGRQIHPVGDLGHLALLALVGPVSR